LFDVELANCWISFGFINNAMRGADPDEGDDGARFYNFRDTEDGAGEIEKASV